MKEKIQIFFFYIFCINLVFAQPPIDVIKTRPSPKPEITVKKTQPDSPKPPTETGISNKTSVDNKANPSPMTLEELTNRIYQLEKQVDYLQSKIKFSDFSVIEYEVKSDDLIPTENSIIRYKNDVRINHPILNNQPNLKLLVRSEEEIAVTTFFKDSYWYIRTPRAKVSNILNWKVGERMEKGKIVEREYEDFLNSGGVLEARFYYPKPGNRFYILAFKDLPNEKGIKAIQEKVKND